MGGWLLHHPCHSKHHRSGLFFFKVSLLGISLNTAEWLSPLPAARSSSLHWAPNKFQLTFLNWVDQEVCLGFSKRSYSRESRVPGPSLSQNHLLLQYPLLYIFYHTYVCPWLSPHLDSELLAGWDWGWLVFPSLMRSSLWHIVPQLMFAKWHGEKNSKSICLYLNEKTIRGLKSSVSLRSLGVSGSVFSRKSLGEMIRWAFHPVYCVGFDILFSLTVFSSLVLWLRKFC